VYGNLDVGEQDGEGCGARERAVADLAPAGAALGAHLADGERGEL